LESTLGQVLDPTAPPRFFLSARAASGILRRALRRRRDLPVELERALTSLVASQDDMVKGSIPPLTTEE
jgi:hypothetical protein